MEGHASNSTRFLHMVGSCALFVLLCSFFVLDYLMTSPLNLTLLPITLIHSVITPPVHAPALSDTGSATTLCLVTPSLLQHCV